MLVTYALTYALTYASFLFIVYAFLIIIYNRSYLRVWKLLGIEATRIWVMIIDACTRMQKQHQCQPPHHVTGSVIPQPPLYCSWRWTCLLHEQTHTELWFWADGSIPHLSLKGGEGKLDNHGGLSSLVVVKLFEDINVLCIVLRMTILLALALEKRKTWIYKWYKNYSKTKYKLIDTCSLN